jgi:hypothetical protein
MEIVGWERVWGEWREARRGGSQDQSWNVRIVQPKSWSILSFYMAGGLLVLFLKVTPATGC